MSDDNWQAQAACLGQTDVMYPEDASDASAIAKAKALCARCPVRPQCREAGRSEGYGIWGGDTATERYLADPEAVGGNVSAALRRTLARRAARG